MNDPNKRVCSRTSSFKFEFKMPHQKRDLKIVPVTSCKARRQNKLANKSWHVMELQAGSSLDLDTNCDVDQSPTPYSNRRLRVTQIDQYLEF